MTDHTTSLEALRARVAEYIWRSNRLGNGAAVHVTGADLASIAEALATPGAGPVDDYEVQTRFGKLKCSLAMICAWEELVEHVNYLEAAIAASALAQAFWTAPQAAAQVSDGERYRFLRDHPNARWSRHGIYGSPTLLVEIPFFEIERVPVNLDKVIDAALRPDISTGEVDRG